LYLKSKFPLSFSFPSHQQKETHYEGEQRQDQTATVPFSFLFSGVELLCPLCPTQVYSPFHDEQSSQFYNLMLRVCCGERE